MIFSIKKNKIKYLFVSLSVLILVFWACDAKKQSNEETILTGTATILVDETVYPVIEDQVMVFENQYNAKIKLVPKSEQEIVKLLSEGKNDLAILTRELSPGEAGKFIEKKIKPKVTDLALDGIAFIANNQSSSIKITKEDLIDFMKGKSNRFSGLVFDNANSSTVKYLMELADVKNLPKDNIYSFKTNNEVITFVAKNPGMVGVVGVNWITQPQPEFQNTVNQVSILEVKAKNGTFVIPTQDYIASETYPYTRKIKMLNYQGYAGLGMGFASFVAGEIGQRIVLKAGLVPVRMPSRNLIIRKEIEKQQN
ncbi:PstS family phosphate ABC transporter substrate-binding protein [Flavobacterium sp. H122]|uniref:PstS family phosphate ABC transporter substrate-binding protein n=1 Tax=Flavobacterium sp. H122 TaxID=2529860 RepID=UPI0010AB4125|nr:substrate-binding domain-containing protein [Flavobacterium sp. H122]